MSSFVERFFDEISDEIERSMNGLEIPFEWIKSATDNFADKNHIGQLGSFGKFYRGQLLQSGKTIDVVVREFNPTAYDITEMMLSFFGLAEMMMLFLLKHENISSILHWARNAADNNDIIFLIYKIEANGSLAEHLLSAGSTTGLTWTRRLSICIGVGRALQYIHNSDFVKPGYYVIHGNIKSSEILLDDNWQPKLKGFESAMVAERNTPFATNKYKGTLQYEDPAYEKTGALTAKSDVFSFGVVLFEVLFGREATTPPSTPNDGTVYSFGVVLFEALFRRRKATAASTHPNEGQEEDNWNFAEFAKLHWKNKALDKMIDPDMRRTMDSESIEIFSNIAYACLTGQQEERPNMDLVVRELERSLELQKYHEHSMVTEISSKHLQVIDYSYFH